MSSSESSKTQIDAFKSIVMLVTCYPGFRPIFMNSPPFRCHTELSDEDVLVIWKRSDLLGETEDFVLHLHFAAACIADRDISSMIEDG
jgi:hypothetical protein